MIDVARWARERPDAPAIVGGDTVVSWSELEGRAEAAAAGLRRIGGPIGLAVSMSVDAVVAVHAAARAGIDVVLVDPRLTEPEITALMAGARAGALLDPSRLPIGTPGTDARAMTTFLVATSGSTARPKLAELPTDRLVASATAWNATVPHATGWLLSLGLEHVAGLGIVVRSALAGVPVAVPPTTPGADGAALLAVIANARERHGVVVSHLSLVAAQLDAIADVVPPDGLRAAIVGGSAVPTELVDRARRAGWPVVVSYGQTETASGIAADGHPLPGVELRIADDAEIQVRGPMVFAGYRGDVAATAEALDADGWRRTGDLGHLDAAGRLIVGGRRDGVIIRGGENISPAEVESALASHPGIAEVAVIGRPDARLGTVPVAAVALRPGADPSDDDLRTHARERLAGTRVPARFVRVKALPKSTLGKVVRADVERLVDAAERRHAVTTDDGIVLSAVETGPGDAHAIVLLHATMASSGHLAGLARMLGADARVIRFDRRGSGASILTDPAPVPVERHVRDAIVILDALGVERAALVGHSFGGVVAIETARCFPDRVRAVVAWEPPYVPVAPAPWDGILAAVATAVETGFAADGSQGAARGFIESVSGPGAWTAIPERPRAAIGRAGTGALADAAMLGLTGEGLATVSAPTLILTGDASEPFYRPVADALAARIGPAATRGELSGGLDHLSPGHSPAPIAAAVRRHLDLPADDEETTP